MLDHNAKQQSSKCDLVTPRVPETLSGVHEGDIVLITTAKRHLSLSLGPHGLTRGPRARAGSSALTAP